MFFPGMAKARAGSTAPINQHPAPLVLENLSTAAYTLQPPLECVVEAKRFVAIGCEEGFQVMEGKPRTDDQYILPGEILKRLAHVDMEKWVEVYPLPDT
jgi:hypothetical protein